MMRLRLLSKCVTNLRNTPHYHTNNSIRWNKLILSTTRLYSNDSGKCDSKDDTKHTKKKEKIPSIQDCPATNEMSSMPPPQCPYEDQDRKNRAKYRNILLAGLLFAAATLAAVYYYNQPEEKKPQTVKKKKKRAFKDPAKSSEIPKKVPYLLIGGGTASFSAFRAIKSADPTAKVLVISNESFFPYMRPPLSKEIWYNDDPESIKKLIFKQWNGSERSLFYEPDDFYTQCKDLMQSQNGGVAVARGWTITHLDVQSKIAYLDDGEPIEYEKCLIATGACPKTSTVFELATATDSVLADRLRVFRNIYDFEDSLEAFENAKSIAIVGGGFLGSELACSLGRKYKKTAKKIYQVFPEGGNLGKILPEYLSQWTTNKVKEENVHVLTSTDVVSVKRENNAVVLGLTNGKKLPVDQIIIAVGVEPNTSLAPRSDLEVDPELGGYLVNTELQARTDLYIAGDCACFYDTKLGRRRIEHHDHAVVSGRLAGENMAGAAKPYLHQSMFWSDLGPDVGFEAIGIVDSSLPTVGVFAKATDKDTPLAVVTETDEGIRSKTEEIPKECDKFLTEEQRKAAEELRKEKNVPDKAQGEDFGKGVVFYLRDEIVVGIVLWNVFNRMSVARQVLKDQRKYDDLNEVAKLFNIHEEQ